MTDPILRIPLSEAEAHRAELAAARELAEHYRCVAADFTVGLNKALDVVDQCRAIIADVANTEAGIPLRQSVVHYEHDPVEPIDVVATVKALVAKVLDLSRKLDDAYYRTATLKIERDEADIAWRDQVKETTKFADLYRGTVEGKEAGEAYKARNEERCACGHIRLEHIGVRCMIQGCGCGSDVADDGVDLPKHREAPPPPKKPAPAAKPVDTRPHVATRRDAHGRRWWTGNDWALGGAAPALARTLDEWKFGSGKPRGSRLVAIDDVPALLAEDAAKDAAKDPP